MKKKHFKAIELKKLDQNTITSIRNWRNQDFVRQNMFHQEIISEEAHIAWIDKLKKDDNRYLFVFYLDDKPFGVEQYEYFPDKDHVEIGNYLLSEDDQALGYGVFMTYFGLDILYNQLHYEKMYGEIVDTNTRAASFSRFFGEEKEVKDEQVEINGVLHDVNIVRGDANSWNNFEKVKLGKLVKRFVEENYEVVM